MRTQEDLRIEILIKEAIKKLRLNLSGLTVLTEAATGNFFVTPIIAAKAGAKVYAVAKDSSYAKKDEAKKNLLEKAKIFKASNINVIYSTEEVMGQADIITNLGAIRPLDNKKVALMKKGAVISLMYEAWELRKEDIDIAACKEKNIRVFATNEDAAGLKIFDFTKPLILKMLFEKGLEVYQNNFIVVSKDKFGKLIKKALEENGGKAILVPPEKIDIKRIKQNRIEGLIIADYLSMETIFGKRGIISSSQFLKRFPGAKIIQFAGKIDGSKLAPQKMIHTFSHLGPKPVIDLMAAGLKVGEEMVKHPKKKSELCQEII